MNDINILRRNELLAKKVIKSLEKRNFEAFYCAKKEDVIEQLKTLISKEETISWGGSMTINELRIKEFLKDNGYKTIDRDTAKTKEERRKLILEGLAGNVFLMSANAISEDGEIVNIDGHGNRIAALCYGPDKIIIIAGVNKIAKTLDDAITRARNYAAPINSQRISSIYEMSTPCLSIGSCMDCKSETSICTHILTTRLSYPKGRIKVILVNETLGY